MIGYGGNRLTRTFTLSLPYIGIGIPFFGVSNRKTNLESTLIFGKLTCMSNVCKKNRPKSPNTSQKILNLT